MGFLDLVNRRLDHLQAYTSFRYYRDTKYLAAQWIKAWGKLNCDDINTEMIQDYVLKRSKVSKYTGNKELRLLRALFNFGVKKKYITDNPTIAIEFFPKEKKVRYVPSKEDVAKVLLAAEPEVQDYLYCIKETLARSIEINRLTWDDVNFDGRFVILYTRKKKGGSLTPRKVPMTNKLFEVLSRRHARRDLRKPWVFWHSWTNQKTGKELYGPYGDRRRIMRTLCKKVGVKYFRFHALRHFSASVLDNANVGIGSIQRILGHENRLTTEIYLHSMGDSDRMAMDVLDAETNVLEKSPTQSPTQAGFAKKRKG